MTFSGAILNFGGVGAQNEGDKNTLRIQSKLSREHAQSQTQTKTWIYMKDAWNKNPNVFSQMAKWWFSLIENG